MYGRASVEIAATSTAVIDRVTDAGSWPDWWSLGRATPGSLGQPGVVLPGTWHWGGTPKPVSWSVRRRVRDVVALTVRDDAAIADVTLSGSPWAGGCLFEIRVETAGRDRRSSRLEAVLRRDLGRLAASMGSVLPGTSPALPRSARDGADVLAPSLLGGARSPRTVGR